MSAPDRRAMLYRADRTLSIKVVAGIQDPDDVDAGTYQVPG